MLHIGARNPDVLPNDRWWVRRAVASLGGSFGLLVSTSLLASIYLNRHWSRRHASTPTKLRML